MIVQEPVQAAIWHCLNHYDYVDAVFLSERLYAEVKTEESLFLLATAYFRNGQKEHAYHTLKERTGNSAQCRYLFGICAYELEKYAEAETVLLENTYSENSLDDEDLIKDFGEEASFVLMLLGKISVKTERKARAIEAWTKALKLNPFLWTTFEDLCKIGGQPHPQSIFQINNMDVLMRQGNSISNVENVIIANNTPNIETPDTYLTTPPQILGSFNTVNVNKPLFTPEESPLAQPLCLSGIRPLKYRKDLHSGSPQPSFGHLFYNENSGTPNLMSPPTLTESNMIHHQSLAKRVRAQMDQLISRNCKPVFSQSTNVPVTKTPTIPLAVQPGQNVRRSSRLFSNSYSVKENNKSPNR